LPFPHPLYRYSLFLSPLPFRFLIEQLFSSFLSSYFGAEPQADDHIPPPMSSFSFSATLFPVMSFFSSAVHPRATLEYSIMGGARGQAMSVPPYTWRSSSPAPAASPIPLNRMSAYTFPRSLFRAPGGFLECFLFLVVFLRVVFFGGCLGVCEGGGFFFFFLSGAS